MGPQDRAMKMKAVLMALAMMTTALAGCTSGTDGVPEVDEDALNELIQDNLQDFINNTTVVVNQDFHYHNNTTYVVDDGDYSTNVLNEYNNTTNIDGGEVNNQNTDNSVNHYNGSGSGSAMQMFTVSWGIRDYIGYDPVERIVTGNGTSGGPTLLYVTFYNGQVIEFRDVSCEDWWNYRYWYYEDWEYWLDDNYGAPTEWGDREDVARDIRDHFEGNDYSGYQADDQCNVDGSYLGSSHLDPNSRVVLYEIELEEGQAMSYLVTTQYVTVEVNCDDGYGTGLGNGTSTGYIGGQANCTVTGSTLPYWELDAISCKLGENGTCLTMSNYSSRLLYNWDVAVAGGAPNSFAVYFMMHDVEVYDLGTE